MLRKTSDRAKFFSAASHLTGPGGGTSWEGFGPDMTGAEEKYGDGLRAGRRVLEGELKGLEHLLRRIEAPLAEALALLLPCPRKIIVCGVGKSGHVGRKIAATLNSTGSRSVFLHPCEALHGDLGVYEDGDPVLLLSKSGSSEEILRLLPFFKKNRSPLIAILGNRHNPIALQADVLFDIAVGVESDPLGVVPTTSALLTLAVGDAIACALMAERRFSQKNFVTFHPAGQIGRNLLLQVRDVMHPLPRVAGVPAEAPLRELVIAMTEYPLGAALVLEKKGENHRLLGIITDGDIRRLLREGRDIDRATAGQIMSRHFRFIAPDRSLGEAVSLMEEGDSQVHVLPVIAGEPGDNTALGLLRLHDAYRHH